MRPRLIIPRLRAQCPIFENRVAGSIDYKRAVTNDDLPVPHAFVLLQGITPTGEELLSGLDQEVNSQLSVVIAVSSAVDARGQDAGEQLITCFAQVRDALLGWSPDPALYGLILMDGLTLAEGESFTRARSWAQCDITSTALVRDLT